MQKYAKAKRNAGKQRQRLRKKKINYRLTVFAPNKSAT